LARAKTGTSGSGDQNNGVAGQQVSPGSRRTITNKDLETLKRRRQDNDAAYETKRKQLGLPSLEESRQRAAAELDLATTELARKRNEEKQTEDYWRSRAAALRSEMAVLDAELNYIQSRLDEGPFSTPGWGGSYSTVGSILAFGNFRGSGNFGGNSFGNFGRGRSFRGQVGHRPNVYVAPSYSPQLRARVGFGGGAARGRVLVNPGGFRHSRQIGGVGVIGVAPGVTVSGFPVQGYDFAYELGALITRFNELAAARAGVNARWRELEDEARRGGVSPGWLRP